MIRWSTKHTLSFATGGTNCYSVDKRQRCVISDFCFALGGDRTERLFQFLNLIEARALSRHLGRVQEMAEDWADGWECEPKIARRFGFEQLLELPVPLPVPAQRGVAN
jgi:hypothetical protein